MRRHLAIVSILAGTALAACSEDEEPAPIEQNRRVTGQTGSLSGQTVTTYATLDLEDRVTEIGVSIPFAAISAVSAEETVVAEFPDDVSDDLDFDHLQLGYLPHGHPPVFWQAPHFDVHFHRISIGEREEIDCLDEPMPDSDRLPAGYVIPGTGLEPDGTCVPAMGIHAFDPTAPEVTAMGPFTSTVIFGYHDGELSFVEPMITLAQIQTKASIDAAVPLPPNLEGRSSPTRFTATYQPTTDSYEIVLSSFQAAPVTP
jgi:hypothetical protein